MYIGTMNLASLCNIISFFFHSMSLCIKKFTIRTISRSFLYRTCQTVQNLKLSLCRYVTLELSCHHARIGNDQNHWENVKVETRGSNRSIPSDSFLRSVLLSDCGQEVRNVTKIIVIKSNSKFINVKFMYGCMQFFFNKNYLRYHKNCCSHPREKILCRTKKLEIEMLVPVGSSENSKSRWSNESDSCACHRIVLNDSA